jgi:hypothetical protein
MRCGLVGWKPRSEVDVPYWIVSTICELTGTLPANATAMLTAPPDGLRLTLEPEMVQFCEYAASLSSEAVKAWLLDLREGISERDSAEHLQSYGLELSCHPMVNFGRSIPSGLKSPRNAVARRGEYAQCAFGVIGGLTCRAGRLIDSRMPDADHYLELVESYLAVVSAWYGAVRVGVTAGEVVAASVAAKSALWEFALNPGHLLNLEEWAASPFVTGSNVPLRSGNAVQQDIIPIPRNSPAMINMEDGLILADQDLRAELQKLDRSLVARCETRRALMEELGYSLSDDILPLSNVAGVFFPFLLETQLVASLR